MWGASHLNRPYAISQKASQSSVSPLVSLCPSQFYKVLGIRVALTGLEIWTDGDKISVSANPYSTLGSFLAWRRKQLRLAPNDNAQLITSVLTAPPAACHTCISSPTRWLEVPDGACVSVYAGESPSREPPLDWHR